MAVVELEVRLRRSADDWAGWLVYGDGLLERGDPRGELIRLEHMVATARPHPEGRDLRAAIDRLFAEHGSAWRGPVPEDAKVAFCHGFLREVTLRYDEETAPSLAALLASDEARFLTTVRLRPLEEEVEEDWDDEDFDEEEFEARMMAPPAPLPPSFAEALAALELSPIETLDLSYCRLGSEGVRALFAAPTLRSVTTLDLRYNVLGDAGVTALAEWPGLAGVTSLGLANNLLGPSGATALFASPHLSRLSSLDLRYNTIGAAGARALADSPAVTTLQRLLLFRDDVDDGGADALAASRKLPTPLRRFWNAR